MTKKNKVQINSIFSDLIVRHKLSMLLIFLACILISYSYNNIFKTVFSNYSIELNIGQVKILAIGSDSSQPNTQIYKKIIFQQLKKLPHNVQNKKIIYMDITNTILVSFDSIGKNVIKLENFNFVETINTEIKKQTYQNIVGMYENALWNRELKQYFDFNQVLDLFETNYPNIDTRLPLDSFIEFKVNEMNAKSSMEAKLRRLKYTIDNYDKVFIGDYLYSLNGWKIKDNIFNKLEIFIAGILFGSLISSFFLFFKSNYFKRKLSN